MRVLTEEFIENSSTEAVLQAVRGILSKQSKCGGICTTNVREVILRKDLGSELVPRQGLLETISEARVAP